MKKLLTWPLLAAAIMAALVSKADALGTCSADEVGTFRTGTTLLSDGCTWVYTDQCVAGTWYGQPDDSWLFVSGYEVCRDPISSPRGPLTPMY